MLGPVRESRSAPNLQSFANLLFDEKKSNTSLYSNDSFFTAVNQEYIHEKEFARNALSSKSCSVDASLFTNNSKLNGLPSESSSNSIQSDTIRKYLSKYIYHKPLLEIEHWLEYQVFPVELQPLTSNSFTHVPSYEIQSAILDSQLSNELKHYSNIYSELRNSNTKMGKNQVLKMKQPIPNERFYNRNVIAAPSADPIREISFHRNQSMKILKAPSHEKLRTCNKFELPFEKIILTAESDKPRKELRAPSSREFSKILVPHADLPQNFQHLNYINPLYYVQPPLNILPKTQSECSVECTGLPRSRYVASPNREITRKKSVTLVETAAPDQSSVIKEMTEQGRNIVTEEVTEEDTSGRTRKIRTVTEDIDESVINRKSLNPKCNNSPGNIAKRKSVTLMEEIPTGRKSVINEEIIEDSSGHVSQIRSINDEYDDKDRFNQNLNNIINKKMVTLIETDPIGRSSVINEISEVDSYGRISKAQTINNGFEDIRPANNYCNNASNITSCTDQVPLNCDRDRICLAPKTNTKSDADSIRICTKSDQYSRQSRINPTSRNCNINPEVVTTQPKPCKNRIEIPSESQKCKKNKSYRNRKPDNDLGTKEYVCVNNRSYTSDCNKERNSVMVQNVSNIVNNGCTETSLQSVSRIDLGNCNNEFNVTSCADQMPQNFDRDMICSTPKPNTDSIQNCANSYPYPRQSRIRDTSKNCSAYVEDQNDCVSNQSKSCNNKVEMPPMPQKCKKAKTYRNKKPDSDLGTKEYVCVSNKSCALDCNKERSSMLVQNVSNIENGNCLQSSLQIVPSATIIISDTTLTRQNLLSQGECRSSQQPISRLSVISTPPCNNKEVFQRNCTFFEQSTVSPYNQSECASTIQQCAEENIVKNDLELRDNSKMSKNKQKNNSCYIGGKSKKKIDACACDENIIVPPTYESLRDSCRQPQLAQNIETMQNQNNSCSSAQQLQSNSCSSTQQVQSNSCSSNQQLRGNSCSSNTQLQSNSCSSTQQLQSNDCCEINPPNTVMQRLPAVQNNKCTEEYNEYPRVIEKKNVNRKEKKTKKSCYIGGNSKKDIDNCACDNIPRVSRISQNIPRENTCPERTSPILTEDHISTSTSFQCQQNPCDSNSQEYQPTEKIQLRRSTIKLNNLTGQSIISQSVGGCNNNSLRNSRMSTISQNLPSECPAALPQNRCGTGGLEVQPTDEYYEPSPRASIKKAKSQKKKSKKSSDTVEKPSKRIDRCACDTTDVLSSTSPSNNACRESRISDHALSIYQSGDITCGTGLDTISLTTRASRLSLQIPRNSILVSDTCNQRISTVSVKSKPSITYADEPKKSSKKQPKQSKATCYIKGKSKPNKPTDLCACDNPLLINSKELLEPCKCLEVPPNKKKTRQTVCECKTQMGKDDDSKKRKSVERHPCTAENITVIECSSSGQIKTTRNSSSKGRPEKEKSNKSVVSIFNANPKRTKSRSRSLQSKNSSVIRVSDSKRSLDSIKIFKAESTRKRNKKSLSKIKSKTNHRKSIQNKDNKSQNECKPCKKNKESKNTDADRKVSTIYLACPKENVTTRRSVIVVPNISSKSILSFQPTSSQLCCENIKNTKYDEVADDGCLTNRKDIRSSIGPRSNIPDKFESQMPRSSVLKRDSMGPQKTSVVGGINESRVYHPTFLNNSRDSVVSNYPLTDNVIEPRNSQMIRRSTTINKEETIDQNRNAYNENMFTTPRDTFRKSTNIIEEEMTYQMDNDNNVLEPRESYMRKSIIEVPETVNQNVLTESNTNARISESFQRRSTAYFDKEQSPLSAKSVADSQYSVQQKPDELVEPRMSQISEKSTILTEDTDNENIYPQCPRTSLLSNRRSSALTQPRMNSIISEETLKSMEEKTCCANDNTYIAPPMMLIAPQEKPKKKASCLSMCKKTKPSKSKESIVMLNADSRRSTIITPEMTRDYRPPTDSQCCSKYKNRTHNADIGSIYPEQSKKSFITDDQMDSEYPFPNNSSRTSANSQRRSSAFLEPTSSQIPRKCTILNEDKNNENMYPQYPRTSVLSNRRSSNISQPRINSIIPGETLELMNRKDCCANDNTCTSPITDDQMDNSDYPFPNNSSRTSANSQRRSSALLEPTFSQVPRKSTILNEDIDNENMYPHCPRTSVLSNRKSRMNSIIPEETLESMNKKACCANDNTYIAPPMMLISAQEKPKKKASCLSMCKKTKSSKSKESIVTLNADSRRSTIIAPEMSRKSLVVGLPADSQCCSKYKNRSYNADIGSVYDPDNNSRTSITYPRSSLLEPEQSQKSFLTDDEMNNLENQFPDNSSRTSASSQRRSSAFLEPRSSQIPRKSTMLNEDADNENMYPQCPRTSVLSNRKSRMNSIIPEETLESMNKKACCENDNTYISPPMMLIAPQETPKKKGSCLNVCKKTKPSKSKESIVRLSAVSRRNTIIAPEMSRKSLAVVPPDSQCCSKYNKRSYNADMGSIYDPDNNSRTSITYPTSSLLEPEQSKKSFITDDEMNNLENPFPDNSSRTSAYSQRKSGAFLEPTTSQIPRKSTIITEENVVEQVNNENIYSEPPKMSSFYQRRSTVESSPAISLDESMAMPTEISRKSTIITEENMTQPANYENIYQQPSNTSQLCQRRPTILSQPRTSLIPEEDLMPIPSQVSRKLINISEDNMIQQSNNQNINSQRTNASSCSQRRATILSQPRTSLIPEEGLLPTPSKVSRNSINESEDNLMKKTNNQNTYAQRPNTSSCCQRRATILTQPKTSFIIPEEGPQIMDNRISSQNAYIMPQTVSALSQSKPKKKVKCINLCKKTKSKEQVPEQIILCKQKMIPRTNGSSFATTPRRSTLSEGQILTSESVVLNNTNDDTFPSASRTSILSQNKSTENLQNKMAYAPFTSDEDVLSGQENDSNNMFRAPVRSSIVSRKSTADSPKMTRRSTTIIEEFVGEPENEDALDVPRNSIVTGETTHTTYNNDGDAATYPANVTKIVKKLTIATDDRMSNDAQFPNDLYLTGDRLSQGNIKRTSTIMSQPKYTSTIPVSEADLNNQPQMQQGIYPATQVINSNPCFCKTQSINLQSNIDPSNPYDDLRLFKFTKMPNAATDNLINQPQMQQGIYPTTQVINSNPCFCKPPSINVQSNIDPSNPYDDSRLSKFNKTPNAATNNVMNQTQMQQGICPATQALNSNPCFCKSQSPDLQPNLKKMDNYDVRQSTFPKMLNVPMDNLMSQSQKLQGIYPDTQKRNSNTNVCKCVGPDLKINMDTINQYDVRQCKCSQILNDPMDNMYNPEIRDSIFSQRASRLASTFEDTATQDNLQRMSRASNASRRTKYSRDPRACNKSTVPDDFGMQPDNNVSIYPSSKTFDDDKFYEPDDDIYMEPPRKSSIGISPPRDSRISTTSKVSFKRYSGNNDYLDDNLDPRRASTVFKKSICDRSTQSIGSDHMENSDSEYDIRSNVNRKSVVSSRPSYMYDQNRISDLSNKYTQKSETILVGDSSYENNQNISNTSINDADMFKNKKSSKKKKKSYCMPKKKSKQNVNQSTQGVIFPRRSTLNDAQSQRDSVYRSTSIEPNNRRYTQTETVTTDYTNVSNIPSVITRSKSIQMQDAEVGVNESKELGQCLFPSTDNIGKKSVAIMDTLGSPAIGASKQLISQPGNNKYFMDFGTGMPLEEPVASPSEPYKLMGTSRALVPSISDKYVAMTESMQQPPDETNIYTAPEVIPERASMIPGKDTRPICHTCGPCLDCRNQIRYEEADRICMHRLSTIPLESRKSRLSKRFSSMFNKSRTSASNLTDSDKISNGSKLSLISNKIRDSVMSRKSRKSRQLEMDNDLNQGETQTSNTLLNQSIINDISRTGPYLNNSRITPRYSLVPNDQIPIETIQPRMSLVPQNPGLPTEWSVPPITNIPRYSIVPPVNTYSPQSQDPRLSQCQDPRLSQYQEQRVSLGQGPTLSYNKDPRISLPPYQDQRVLTYPDSRISQSPDPINLIPLDPQMSYQDQRFSTYNDPTISQLQDPVVPMAADPRTFTQDQRLSVPLDPRVTYEDQRISTYADPRISKSQNPNITVASNPEISQDERVSTNKYGSILTTKELVSDDPYNTDVIQRTYSANVFATPPRRPERSYSKLKQKVVTEPCDYYVEEGNKPRKSLIKRKRSRCSKKSKEIDNSGDSSKYPRKSSSTIINMHCRDSECYMDRTRRGGSLSSMEAKSIMSRPSDTMLDDSSPSVIQIDSTKSDSEVSRKKSCCYRSKSKESKKSRKSLNEANSKTSLCRKKSKKSRKSLSRKSSSRKSLKSESKKSCIKKKSKRSHSKSISRDSSSSVSGTKSRKSESKKRSKKSSCKKDSVPKDKSSKSVCCKKSKNTISKRDLRNSRKSLSRKSSILYKDISDKSMSSKNLAALKESIYSRYANNSENGQQTCCMDNVETARNGDRTSMRRTTVFKAEDGSLERGFDNNNFIDDGEQKDDYKDDGTQSSDTNKFNRNPNSCNANTKKTPCQIRYAQTVISKFKDFTIYEVMKSSDKKPSKALDVTEGVFVVKKGC